MKTEKQHGLKANVGGYMWDMYQCSCGFMTDGFWDGAEFCEEQFAEHLANPDLTLEQIRSAVNSRR